MKTRFAPRMFGLGSVLALAIDLGSSAFAGPSPQYWNQMEHIRAENAAKTRGTKAVRPVADANAMACAVCKTETIREYSSGLPSGKGTPRWTDIGRKHTCDHCSGAIAVVRGKTTNSMQQDCPMCGKDASLCIAAVQGPAKT